MTLTTKQTNVLRGFARSQYFQLSASESGDPEIQQMFDEGLVKSYLAGGLMWHLTRKGREQAVELGLLDTADILVMDAALGKVIRVED